MTLKGPTKAEVRQLVSEHLAEQYVRGASSVDPSIGLERLHELLTQSAQAYETGPSQQREAICETVIAVSDFLKGQGFGVATLAPLSRVVRSIVELCNQNRPDPLFCERPKRITPSRRLDDAVRQGHLAALADAWLKSYSNEEGGRVKTLERAARQMSGAHFGTLSKTMLNTAMTYQRQEGHHELVYLSFQQMQAALAAEASLAGGGKDGLRTALLAQIDALNAKAQLQEH